MHGLVSQKSSSSPWLDMISVTLLSTNKTNHSSASYGLCSGTTWWWAEFSWNCGGDPFSVDCGGKPLALKINCPSISIYRHSYIRIHMKFHFIWSSLCWVWPWAARPAAAVFALQCRRPSAFLRSINKLSAWPHLPESRSVRI